MDLTLQLFFEKNWHEVGSLTLRAPNAGYLGATTVGYDAEYFYDFGSIQFAEDKPVRGRAGAVSWGSHRPRRSRPSDMAAIFTRPATAGFATKPHRGSLGD